MVYPQTPGHKTGIPKPTYAQGEIISTAPSLFFLLPLPIISFINGKAVPSLLQDAR